MKKRIVLVFIVLFLSSFGIYAQNQTTEPVQEPIVPYRLYKTTNNWTFIQLETTTGKMWQIQYSVQDDNRGGVVLNDKNLAKDKEVVVGRFTLYPTSNMWTFILLDQISGSSWQVQWSFDEKNRFVTPIY
jgi:hypothetical protein